MGEKRLLDRFGSGCYADGHLVLGSHNAMIDSTRSIASLCAAALLAAMAGCSLVSEGNTSWDTDITSWDTDIPQREAFDAADGT